MLTGERPVPPTDADWQPENLLAWLADQGWDAERLGRRRSEHQAAARPWPDPLPADLAEELAFAQYTALLARVRSLAGLDGLRTTVHAGPRVIGPQEARLLAEVPPHHVAR